MHDYCLKYKEKVDSGEIPTDLESSTFRYYSDLCYEDGIATETFSPKPPLWGLDKGIENGKKANNIRVNQERAKGTERRIDSGPAKGTGVETCQRKAESKTESGEVDR